MALQDRPYTTKQMGDAGEMLVAAELTLAGIPALIVPGLWPHYDVLAQPPRSWPGYKSGRDYRPQRISVKTRSHTTRMLSYDGNAAFDWLAIVVLTGSRYEQRRIFIVPHKVAVDRSYKRRHKGGDRGHFVKNVLQVPPSEWRRRPLPPGGFGLGDYEDNFELLHERHLGRR